MLTALKKLFFLKLLYTLSIVVIILIYDDYSAKQLLSFFLNYLYMSLNFLLFLSLFNILILQESLSESDNEHLRKGNEIIQKLKENSSKSNTTITRKIFTSEKSKSVYSESSSVTRDLSAAKSRPPKPVKNTVKLPPLSITVYATTETEIPFFICSTTSSPNLILGGGNNPLGSCPLSPSFGPNR